MKHSETAELLGVIAAFDQRTVGVADVEAWQLVLHDLDAADCKHAVVEWHKLPHERRMQPGDVRAEVSRIAAARQAHPVDVPDADPDDTVAYLAAYREGRKRDGSKDVALPGWDPTRVTFAPTSGMPDWFREEFETSRDKARVDAWGWVQCPNCGDHKPPPDQALRYPTHKCTGSAS